jgi:polyribonucleotide nucleotidyltransferase
LDNGEAAIKKSADKFVTQQANMTTEEMEIDADDVGLVVGKAGSTVKYITRTSGADITIAKDSTITISGSSEQVEMAKKLITETIERKGPPEEEAWTEPVATVTPKPKKVEKKVNAPDLEAKELFPSLGAALSGAGSKRAMKSAKMQLKQKAEAEENGTHDYEPPERNGHAKAAPAAPAVLFETKQSSIGAISGTHNNYWKDFRAESANALEKLAATED